MTENEMLRIALDRMTKVLDDLVRDCLDDQEKHKAPSYKALMRARGFLTPACPMSLSKKIPGITLDKSGNVGTDIDKYFKLIRKKDSRKAVGILCGHLPEDTGTIIINEQSFVMYNYEMDSDAMQEAVDGMDDLEKMQVNWDQQDNAGRH